MSTGLAASVGLPTAAAAGQNAAGPKTAAPTAKTAANQALSLLTLPRSVSSGAPVAASSTAKVSFTSATTFTAVPKPKPKPVAQRTERNSVAKASRSTSRTSTSSSPAPSQGASSNTILSIAARYVGVPYVYGGESPSGFDCSGFTQYVFKQVGIKLPRTSSAQYSAVTHISKASAKPGDLVFFLDGGGVYHVGIYAGGNMMYDSPKPGGQVSKRSIWSATIRFGRP